MGALRAERERTESGRPCTGYAGAQQVHAAVDRVDRDAALRLEIERDLDRRANIVPTADYASAHGHVGHRAVVSQNAGARIVRERRSRLQRSRERVAAVVSEP